MRRIRRETPSFADSISRDRTFPVLDSRISPRVIWNAGEKRLLVDTYLIVSAIVIRDYGVPLKFPSLRSLFVVVVVVVVVVVGHVGPHEDALLIGRCQWFDPS